MVGQQQNLKKEFLMGSVSNMKKTILCHFYNEEYLLPWWLKHHREIFDHGIMINYKSTDKSVDLIKNYCPTWQIVDSRNELFGALDTDREVMDYEKQIDGYRIALNVTEFLVGNISKLYSQYNQPIHAPCISMIDTKEQEGLYPDVEIPLTKQRFFGVNPFNSSGPNSGSRLLHQEKNIQYGAGRHFWYNKDNLGFFILRYKHSPWNNLFIKRKMQIAEKMLPSDLLQGFGTHHTYNLQQLEDEKVPYRQVSENILPLIQNLEYWHYGDKK